MLSVVIPSYNEAGLVLPAARTIGTILAEAHIEYELIFVDDGSRDGTWDEIQAAHRALYQSETPPLIFRRVIRIPAEKPAPARKD